MNKRYTIGSIILVCVFTFGSFQYVVADGGVNYIDVTQRVGVRYSRVGSETLTSTDFLRSLNPITFSDIVLFPLKGNGAPGVSIFDYDNDGDLDFFVSNGPGRNHSLFQNQLIQSGKLRFIDVAEAAGVAAPEQDGTGSCFGDIDNDGNQDLLVLGRAEQHRLFRNTGGGTFQDLGTASGIGSGSGSPSCAMGDIDNDGLLDIFIAETYNDWSTFIPIVIEPFALNVHNELYLNLGNATFQDVSEERGITDLESGGLPPDVATITWAVSMVDFDQDGDLDLLHSDDQATVPGKRRGGVDRGFIHLFVNDGTGHFTNKTIERGSNVVGHWMSFSWADYDCNGQLDFFSTNVGDYIYQVLFETAEVPYELGEWPSAWFYQSDLNTFEFPPVGDKLVATPWGWGSSGVDYDNDGDTDIIFHGGLNVGFMAVIDNPGVVLQNQGCRRIFTWDKEAVQRSHTRRGVEGIASGDLNQDGFPDIISAAGFVVPDDAKLVKFNPWGSVFDDVAFKSNLLTPLNDLLFGPGKEFVWEKQDVEEGDVVVEINTAENKNHWIAVKVMGSIGLTEGGSVNRDGIGAIVSVIPTDQHGGEEVGKTAMQPITAGGQYASQDALEKTFGLGTSRRATINVFWPGEVRNRLFSVRHGERVTFPEIPCSVDGTFVTMGDYVQCVRESLDDLVRAEVISRENMERFLDSAVRARLEFLDN